MSQFSEALKEMREIARKSRDSKRGGKKSRAEGAELPTVSMLRRPKNRRWVKDK